MQALESAKHSSMKYFRLLLSSILLIVVLTSCKESEHEKLILKCYEKEMQKKNTDFKISNLVFIEKQIVGDEYYQNLIIDDFNSIIMDSEKMISLNEENIELYKERIEEINKVTKVNYSEGVDNFKIGEAKDQIKVLKDNIAYYKKELRNFKKESDSLKSEQTFTVLRHYIDAKFNGQKINDTIDCIFNSDMKFLEFNPDFFNVNL